MRVRFSQRIALQASDAATVDIRHLPCREAVMQALPW